MKEKNLVLIDKLNQFFNADIIDVENCLDEVSIRIEKEKIIPIVKKLKEIPEFSFEQMMDLTAVDYLNYEREKRFQMVYHFFSLTHLHRLRLKCDLDEKDSNIESISKLWLCANWYERECYDMYGINFYNHPELKRILLYEGFEGHPLRKDYPITREQPLLPLKEVKERYNYMEDFGHGYK